MNIYLYFYFFIFINKIICMQYEYIIPTLLAIKDPESNKNTLYKKNIFYDIDLYTSYYEFTEKALCYNSKISKKYKLISSKNTNL